MLLSSLPHLFSVFRSRKMVSGMSYVRDTIPSDYHTFVLCFWFVFLCPVPNVTASANNSDYREITEMLLGVTLKTITCYTQCCLCLWIVHSLLLLPLWFSLMFISHNLHTPTRKKLLFCICIIHIFSWRLQKSKPHFN